MEGLSLQAPSSRLGVGNPQSRIQGLGFRGLGVYGYWGFFGKLGKKTTTSFCRLGFRIPKIKVACGYVRKGLRLLLGPPFMETTMAPSLGRRVDPQNMTLFKYSKAWGI